MKDIANIAADHEHSVNKIEANNPKTTSRPAFPIQCKLTVGAVEDPLEQEADAMAEKVMRMPEPNYIQRRCADCEQEDTVQRKPLASFIQKKSSQQRSFTASDATSAGIESTRGSGSPLPDSTAKFMSQRFGSDFSDVRIHNNAHAAALNKDLSAQAFTVGNDIYFNEGKYAPETSEGKRLLAHELTHTVQQKGISKSAPIAQRSIWGSIKGFVGSVGRGIKKVASAIGKGLSKVGESSVWIVEQIADKFKAAILRIGSFLVRFPERVVRVLSTLIEGLKSFKPWTLSWWESLAKGQSWIDFAKWAGALLLQTLEVGGIGEIAETIIDFIKFNTRSLNTKEYKAARTIFGNSIMLDLVRVDALSVIGPLFTQRAFTSFHIINSWGTESTDVTMHELTHVWQYGSAGAIYMPQAIHAQAWGAGYNYGSYVDLKNKKKAGATFSSFNREQQGQIVQDFYKLRDRVLPNPSVAEKEELRTYAHFVKDVSTLTVDQLITTKP